jgi:hypothetical protein
MSTHDKQKYCVEIGRKLIFMARPQPTKDKRYREPIIIGHLYKLDILGVQGLCVRLG